MKYLIVPYSTLSILENENDIQVFNIDKIIYTWKRIKKTNTWTEQNTVIHGNVKKKFIFKLILNMISRKMTPEQYQIAKDTIYLYFDL